MRKQLGRHANFWFKSSVAGGLLLALISVGVAVATYRYVAGHLALDHLNREAGRYAAVLEYRAQEEAVKTSAELTALLQGLADQETRVPFRRSNNSPPAGRSWECCPRPPTRRGTGN